MLFIALYLALICTASPTAVYRRTVEMAIPNAPYSDDVTVRQMQESLERMRKRMNDIRFSSSGVVSARKQKSLTSAIARLEAVIKSLPVNLPATVVSTGQRVQFATAPQGANGAPNMPVRSEEAPPAQPNVPTTPARGANGAPIMPVRSTDH